MTIIRHFMYSFTITDTVNNVFIELGLVILRKANRSIIKKKTQQL